MDDADLSRLDAAVTSITNELAALKAEVQALREAMPSAQRAPASAAAPAPAPVVTQPQIVVAPAVQQPVPKSPAAPRKPRSSSDIESAVGQRWLLFVGAFLVLCGAAFFLKIAFDRNWIGPWTRVALGIVSGAVLIAFAQLRRSKLPPYFADTVIGLGAGIEYLSLYAASMSFSLMPVSEAYLGMCAVTAVVGLISYVSRRQPLLYVALTAGYLTPLFFNDPHPNILGLFVYLAILSAFSVAIAQLRDWQAPSLISLCAVTFYWLGWAIGWQEVLPWSQALPTAVVLYAVFASTSLVAWRRNRPLKTIDIVVLALNAVVFLGLASAMGYDHRLQLAITLLVVVAAHVGVFAVSKQRAQLWLAVLALVFAVPPLAFTISPHNNEIALVLMHLGWIALAALSASTAVAAKDRTLLWIAGLLGVTVALHVYVLYVNIFGLGDNPYSAVSSFTNNHDYRIVLNDRFISLAALAFATFYVIRSARAAAWLQSGWQLGLRIAFDLLVLFAISPEAWNIGYHLSQSAGLLAISLTWAIYGGALVAFGFRTNAPDRRWTGLVLLGITVIKVLSIDLTGLDIALRVVSAMVCGIVLIALAFMYQRRMAAAAARNAE